MKGLSEKYYLLSEGGFAGYFALNARRGEIQESFNEIMKLYLKRSDLINDLIISIQDLRYTEYEEPTIKTFKKFQK